MPSPSLSRRLTTLWFADIAGFTRLSAQNEPLALQAMEAMRACVKASVSAHHGAVIKFLGDGALSEFPSTEGAVEAALELNARFKGATAGMAGGPFQLHIGIHVGDVTVSSDGDIFGDGVNRAARLEHLGEAGQILVSEEVFRLVRKRTEFHFTPLGERTAKGLDEPFQIFGVAPHGAMVERLAQIEKNPLPPAPLAVPAQRPWHSRAIGTGIVAGVAAFIGLGIWTAFGGTEETEPPSAETSPPLISVPVPASLPLPARDRAYTLPAWPGAKGGAAGAAPPTTLAGLASLGDRYLATLRTKDLSAHEVLPYVRDALNEVRKGRPSAARADAIRGLLLFMVARDPVAAEEAFHASLAAEPAGQTRLLYAKLLTAWGGRSSEALFQIVQAKGKGVSDAALDAARGAVLFREGRAGEAKDALERSLKSEDLLATRILLARALIAQEKPKDALRALDRAISSLEVVHWMAFARLRDTSGSDGAAQTRLLQIAQDPDAGYAGAVILHDMGESPKAIQALDRLARSGDPDLIWLAVDPEWA